MTLHAKRTPSLAILHPNFLFFFFLMFSSLLSKAKCGYENQRYVEVGSARNLGFLYFTLKYLLFTKNASQEMASIR